MSGGNPNDHDVSATIARALHLTEEALGEVARIAIEEIHTGLESSSHVEAAERDMRSALKQLVLAERDLRIKTRRKAGIDERSKAIAEIVPGPGSDTARTR